MICKTHSPPLPPTTYKWHPTVGASCRSSTMKWSPFSRENSDTCSAKPIFCLRMAGVSADRLGLGGIRSGGTVPSSGADTSKLRLSCVVRGESGGWRWCKVKSNGMVNEWYVCSCTFSFEDEKEERKRMKKSILLPLTLPSSSLILKQYWKTQIPRASQENSLGVSHCWGYCT